MFKDNTGLKNLGSMLYMFSGKGHTLSNADWYWYTLEDPSKSNSVWLTEVMGEDADDFLFHNMTRYSKDSPLNRPVGMAKGCLSGMDLVYDEAIWFARIRGIIPFPLFDE